MPRGMKFFIGIFCFLPRIAATMLLNFLGCRWLLSTVSLQERLGLRFPKYLVTLMEALLYGLQMSVILGMYEKGLRFASSLALGFQV